METAINYYERHLGDYAKDTGHLSMLEHGAYSLLMDRYYATEQGIPADAAHRLARARSKEEKAAVDAVLAEFFTLTDGVWTKNRIEEEIAKASAKINAAKENGKKGGRPKKADETQEKPTGFSLGYENETQTKALQTPDTRHQEEKETTSSSSLPTIPCPYQSIVDLFHEKLPDLPRVRVLTKQREMALRKRWGWVLSSKKSDGSRRATNASEALAWLGEYFARAAANDFLMGRTQRSPEHAGWKCDIDYLLTDRGLTQVIEKTVEAA